jgi:Spy/CpxP family protein refolding chaperone
VNATKAFLLSLLLLPALALAQDAKPKSDDDWFRGKLFPPELVLKHASQLKLSDAQRKTIRGELTTVQTRVATVDWDIMEAGLAMQEAIEKSPVDRALMLDKADRVFEAEARKKRAWLEMLVNIKNALNAEQIAYLRRVALEGG